MFVQAGYNAIAQLTMLRKNLRDGLLAYATVGVNPTVSYLFQDPWYYVVKNSSEWSASGCITHK